VRYDPTWYERRQNTIYDLWPICSCLYVAAWIHQNCFRTGALSHTPLGELATLPRPSSRLPIPLPSTPKGVHHCYRQKSENGAANELLIWTRSTVRQHYCTATVLGCDLVNSLAAWFSASISKRCEETVTAVNQQLTFTILCKFAVLNKNSICLFLWLSLIYL